MEVVAPFAGAWIEIIYPPMIVSDPLCVAPFAGAWIEIKNVSAWCCTQRPSLPSRERGLKLEFDLRKIIEEIVAPFAGAWIEIWYSCTFNICFSVAPFAGAWIEIGGELGMWQIMPGRSLRGSVD